MIYRVNTTGYVNEDGSVDESTTCIVTPSKAKAEQYIRDLAARNGIAVYDDYFIQPCEYSRYHGWVGIEGCEYFLKS